ncbi:MAG: hypothetical protein ACI9U2_004728, partial [Bradymonadia bacterium]
AGVTLIREETLAAGGRHCPFDLQWASAGADPEAIDPDPEAIDPDPEAIDPDPEAIDPDPEAIVPGHAEPGTATPID